MSKSKAPSGLIYLGRVEPGQQPSKTAPLAPGVWCLHTSSSVPYVTLRGGTTARTITWGEAIEIHESSAVLNASYHAGVIVLAPVVQGIAAVKPRSVTLPVERFTPQTPPLTQRSKRIDVRLVVRAYMVRPNVPFLPGDTFAVTQFADSAIAGTPGGTELGPIQYSIALTAPAGMVALAPNSLQEPSEELRAGAFWDWLEVQAGNAVWGNDPSWFVLHYA